jgi:hypothetical protein
MPTYPIDLPASAAWYKQVCWTQRAVNSFSRNPFSGAQQVYTFGSGWWEVDILLRPMRRDNATDWQSYLMSLHGKEGTFNFSDPVNGVIPRGVWGGTPVVWNPTAPNYYAGNSIWIGVYAPNQLNVVRVGDWFNIANIGGLYQVTATSQNANASGLVWIEFWPPLRGGPAYHGWPVKYASAVGVFRLKDDASYIWDEGKMQMSISFGGLEAL